MWEDPTLIEAAINNTSIISSDWEDNGPKDFFLENNSRGYSFNNNDEDSFIETFIFANNDKENLFKKIQVKEAKLYSTYNHFTELIKIF